MRGDALVTTQAAPDIASSAARATMEKPVSLVREHCGGEISWSLLDRDHPWAVMA